jgi:hypothetical protein
VVTVDWGWAGNSLAPERFREFVFDVPARDAKITQVAFVEDGKRLTFPDPSAPEA